MSRLSALLLAVLLTLTASTAAQTRQRGFIWSVERDGRTSWLVGSIHVLPPDAHPLPASMEQAFGRAKQLLEEIDINDVFSPDVMGAILSKGMFTGNDSLESVLPAPVYQQLARKITDAGMPMVAVRPMKPWMAEITLSQFALQAAGYDAELGIDVYYRRLAGEKGVVFAPLETAAEQIDYLANVPMDIQIAQLKKTIQEGDAELKQVKQITDAWRAGNAATIEQLLVQDMKESPAFYQSLVVNRNRRWMPRVESCLTAGNCFVVVGAAHMVGTDGLIAMLRQKGYRITQQ